MNTAVRAGLLLLVSARASAVALWRRSAMADRRARREHGRRSTPDKPDGRIPLVRTRRTRLASERAAAPGAPDALRPGPHVDCNPSVSSESRRK